MKSIFTLTFLAILLCPVSALPFWYSFVPRDIPLPSQDPFYTQPANINSYNPGAVIRSRIITPALPSTIPGRNAAVNLKSITQYLYRTTDGLGNAVAAVTTLLIPKENTDNTKLLSYQYHYDSANNDCSPSYNIRPESGSRAGDDVIFTIAALDRGWFVVTSDYEGLQAQFTAGLMSGYATLDSIRAVLKAENCARSGLSPNAKYALWGYSGGALASEWAAELAPRYAPELKLAGVALGGLTPNVSSVLYTINKGPLAALAFSGIAGLARIWPNSTAWLNDNLIPTKAAEFRSIANSCSNTAMGAGKNLGDYFINGLDSINEQIPMQLVTTNGLMGYHGVPNTPLYFYKAAGDEVSVVADTDNLYARLCLQGAKIQYERNLAGDHLTEAATGAGGAIEWIADRLAGVPVTITRCVKNNIVVTEVNRDAFEGLDSLLLAALQASSVKTSVR